MNVDLAVLTPAYLDYTFVGLEALPGPGEERFAGDMLRSPGGGAITAVGATRLGLTTALVAPLGDDLAGNFVRRALDEEGVILRRAARLRARRPPWSCPSTASARWSPSIPACAPAPPTSSRCRRAPSPPRSSRSTSCPGTSARFLTCGDDDARAFAGRLPRVEPARRARALIVNRREAGVLTGADTPTRRPRELDAVAEIAAVTLGPEGAVAVFDGRSREGRRMRGDRARHHRRRRPVRRRAGLGGPARRRPGGRARVGEPVRRALGRAPTPAPAAPSRASDWSRRASSAGCRRCHEA